MPALSRGFTWLGGATIIAKIIDFSTILAVLGFLTKHQVGVGSLVVSIGMVIEAVDGFGTNDALVQARSVSRLQLDTLFWFVVGAAALVGGLTMLAAPAIAATDGSAGMTTYFLAIALKQPLVGAALIPLAMLNRELRYERIALVTVCATIGAAATRLGLAMSGAGAWAIVGGYSASGLYILVGALIARPFVPRARFERSALMPLLGFGWRAASSNLFEQIFKNVDYLLVGWCYGAASLALYRVAFDVAMEPAMAVGTVVNRTALPILARVCGVRHELAQALDWSLRRLAMLVAPLMVGLILAAGPLTGLLHDAQGRSYAAAALPLKILALAALPRIASQLLFPLLIGSGRPGVAARLAATTLLLLSAGILVAGLSLRAHDGIIAVAAVWLGVYPLLLGWGARYLRRHWDIRVGALLRPFIAPGVGVAALVAWVEAAGWLPGGAAGPEMQVGIVLGGTIMTYVGLFLHARLGAQPAG